MQATQGEPPAVARQRVTRALRRHRNHTGLSQGDVAQRLGWSLSKMQRIEAGEVGVSITDLRALLAVYGVEDGGEIGRLANDARTSRRQRWLVSKEEREHLTPGLRQLIQFESKAKAIRAYQPVLIPGVLQTAAVAEFVLNYRGNRLSPETRRVRFEVRMRRKAELFERAGGPLYSLILGESVMKSHVGGAEIMAVQLGSLAEVAQRPKVRIRILPFRVGAVIGVEQPFQVLNLEEDDHGDPMVDRESAVLYRETTHGDRIWHDQTEVKSAIDMFDELWAEALDEEASYRAIVAEAASLRSSLDFLR